MEVQLQPVGTTKLDISVRPLQENDLSIADHIMRLAFGTFLGLPDPTAFMGDAGYVRTRWRADPSAAFGAEVGGEFVGSNFASNWGSVGFFGPLTIRPDLWDRGVGKRLMEPIMECFDRWGTKHAGLFTFAHSQKHVGLYQKFGFWPCFLTAIMSKNVGPIGQTGRKLQWTRFSAAPEDAREEMLRSCRQVTDGIYEGLDVGPEVRAVARQGLGATVLLWDNGRLAGLAICHCGPGTEPEAERAPSNSGRRARGRQPGGISTACLTPVRRWPPERVCHAWPLASTPLVTKPIAGCWRVASAQTCRA